MKSVLKDEIGNRYGKLVVLSREKNGTSRMSRWLCRCDCGKETIVYGANLRRGNTKSCGCDAGKHLRTTIYLRRGENGIAITERGDWFIFSWSDYDKIKSYLWRTAGGRTVTWIKGKNVFLSRFLLGATNRLVDHINRNPLDNRRENLRICTYIENSRNRGYRGYSYEADRQAWRVDLEINNVHVFLGRYATEEEARTVRHNAEKKYFGEFAPIREATHG